MNLTVGTVLQDGKYLINHVMGQSGLGITFQGTQSQSRSVVLKTLKPDLQKQPDYAVVKQQFQENVRRFAACQHPALVKLIDSFEEQDLPFAVTDSTPGKTLAEVVESQGALPVETAIRYVQQIGAALDVLHRQGLIHRNITPQAIAQPPASDIVVLVNIEFVDGLPSGIASESITPMAGEYAAIEQYQPQPQLTAATDVYALAGTLYFLLTGHAPIAAPLRSQTAIVSPRQFCPHLTPAIEGVILRGLELNPKSRPTAISEWLSQLTAAHLPAGTPAKSISQPEAVSGATQTRQVVSAPAAHNGSMNGSTPRSQSFSKRSSPMQPQPIISLPSKRFSGAIVTTAIIAAAIGIGAGLTLRFAATTTGPGASFFNSEQSFPALDNWPGEVTPVQQPTIAPQPTLTELQPRRTSIQPEVVPPVPLAPEPAAIAPLPETNVAPANPDPAPAPAPAEPVVPNAAPDPAITVPEPTTANPAPAPEPPPPAPVAPSQPVPPPPLAN